MLAIAMQLHRRPLLVLMIAVAQEKGSGFIVPDGVVGSETNPLRDRAVLLLGLGQLDLGPETLVALLSSKKIAIVSPQFTSINPHRNGRLLHLESSDHRNSPS